MTRKIKNQSKTGTSFRSAQDKFLLSIIDANFGLATTARELADREKRLTVVKQNLLNIRPATGRAHVHDEGCLMFVAEQVLRGKAAQQWRYPAKPPAGAKSFELDEILKAACRKTFGHSPSATISRLRRKYREREKELLETVKYAGDAIEIDELNRIELTREPLRRLGIEIEIKAIRGRS